MSDTSAIIKLEGLDIKSGARGLLLDQSLEIYEGDITLLIGGSGTGKSVFMRLLAGLITPSTPGLEITGRMEVEGRDLISPPLLSLKPHKNPVGIVFQEGGLFDHYSVHKNLDFALQHRPRGDRVTKAEGEALKSRLLEQLEIDPQIPIRHASGGQKRRITIARTLAFDPDIIIYDEPTAGLDPHTSATVARLIRDTHKNFDKKSSIIVTHQYDDFLPFVDRILFLDPNLKQIREVSREEFERVISEGLSKKEEAEAEVEGAARPSALQRVGAAIAGRLEGTTRGLEALVMLALSSVLRVLPLWRRPAWGARFLWHYLKLTSLSSAILYTGIASMILGFVGGYFTFKYLPYAHYTKPLITEEVLGVLGFGFFRIVIPLMIAILIAARSGAAVASDIGNRVYLQEIDAMRSLGGSIKSYIHSNVVLSYMIGVPLLTMMGFALARWVCVAVFLYIYPEFNLVWANSIFHMYLDYSDSYFLVGTGWVLLKQVVSGWGIGGLCYFIASRPKFSSSDISRDITRAIIWATLFVLLTHMIFALFEFESAAI